VTDRLHFRRAVEADVPAIRRIRNAVKENTLPDPERVTYQMCVDYLEALGRGWVCETGDTVVGFSYASRHDSSIWAVFVLPEFEGRGIGRRLLDEAVGWLFGLGHASVSLSTTANTRADRFYQALGWTRGAMKDEVEVCFSLARPSDPGAVPNRH